MSYSGWGGSSGDDSVLIAYDAILFIQDLPLGERWKTLLEHAAVHAGDSDSTAGIACSLFHFFLLYLSPLSFLFSYGALYGFDGVNPYHYKEVEFLDEMNTLGEALLAAASKQDDPLNKPVPLGQLRSETDPDVLSSYPPPSSTKPPHSPPSSTASLPPPPSQPPPQHSN